MLKKIYDTHINELCSIEFVKLYKNLFSVFSDGTTAATTLNGRVKKMKETYTMKRKIIIGSLIAALTVPVLAIAATDGAKKSHHKAGMFERLDTNKDGEITFEEMTARSTERFSKLDKDGNGTISVEEMTVRKKVFFDKLDTDSSGSISMEEAKAFRDKRHENRKERHSARMLELLDADGNGTVSSDEFEAASSKRFEAADTNGDGVLSADELPNLRPGKGDMKKG